MASVKRPIGNLDRGMNYQDENYKTNAIQLRSKGNFEEPVAMNLTTAVKGKPMATRLSRPQRGVMIDIGNNPTQMTAPKSASYTEVVLSKENIIRKPTTNIPYLNSSNIHQSIVEEPKAKRKFHSENVVKSVIQKVLPIVSCNEVDVSMAKSEDMHVDTKGNLTELSDVSMASPDASNSKPQFLHENPTQVIDVKDVDTEDSEDPQMVSIYVNDIMAHLRCLESKYAIQEMYLQGKKGVILPKMRAVLVDWMVEVHQQFTLLQETLYLSVAILDRYMQKAAEFVPRKKLQLVGVTAIFIAAKYEEMYAPEIGDFVYITDNAYSESQLREQEIDMIKQLDFSLERPLPLHFLRRFSKVAQVDTTIHNLAKYIMELTLVEYKYCHVAPSKIAAASLAVSMMVYEGDNKKNIQQLWSPTLEYYAYKLNSIAGLVQDLAQHLLKISGAREATRLMAVRKKYSDKKFVNISMDPKLTGTNVSKLAEGKFE